MKIVSTKLVEKQYKKVPGYVKKKVAELYVVVEGCKAWTDLNSF